MKFNIGKEEIELTRKHAFSYAKFLGVLFLFGVLLYFFTYLYSAFTGIDLYEATSSSSQLIGFSNSLVLILGSYIAFLLLRNKGNSVDKKDVLAFCIINFLFFSSLYLILSLFLPSTYAFFEFFLIGLIKTIVSQGLGSAVIYISVIVIAQYKKLLKDKNLELFAYSLLIVLIGYTLIPLVKEAFIYQGINLVTILPPIPSYILNNLIDILDNAVSAFFILFYFVENKGKISKYFYLIIGLYLCLRVLFDPVSPQNIVFTITFYTLIYAVGKHLVEKGKNDES